MNPTNNVVISTKTLSTFIGDQLDNFNHDTFDFIDHIYYKYRGVEICSNSIMQHVLNDAEYGFPVGEIPIGLLKTELTVYNIELARILTQHFQNNYRNDDESRRYLQDYITLDLMGA
jgi:hypothetical protein